MNTGREATRPSAWTHMKGSAKILSTSVRSLFWSASSKRWSILAMARSVIVLLSAGVWNTNRVETAKTKIDVVTLRF